MKTDSEDAVSSLQLAHLTIGKHYGFSPRSNVSDYHWPIEAHGILSFKAAWFFTPPVFQLSVLPSGYPDQP